MLRQFTRQGRSLAARGWAGKSQVHAAMPCRQLCAAAESPTSSLCSACIAHRDYRPQQLLMRCEGPLGGESGHHYFVIVVILSVILLVDFSEELQSRL